MKQSVKVCLQQHVSYRAAWLASHYTTTNTTTTNANTTTNNNTNNATGDDDNNYDSMMIESAPPPPLPIRTEKEEEEEEEYMGCKYLTSPSLFQLQLSDPNLRQEIITQIIIFLHHFSRRLPFILETAAAASTATATATGGSNVVSIKGKGTQATSRLATTTAAAAASATTTTTTTTATTGRGAKGSVTVTTASAAAASKTEVIPSPTTTATPSALTPIEIAVKNIRHDIALIRKKAYQQLSVTPPNGSELLPFLQRLLQREEHWIAWKKSACTDFERPPATLPTTTSTTDTDTIITAGSGKKVGSVRDSIVAKSAIYVR